MHKIVPGSTDDSYGIYVAKLAGIPESVIKRSKKILSELETGSRAVMRSKKDQDQFNLFSPSSDATMEAVKKALESVDVNTMTPVEALNKLNELKRKMKS